MPDQKLKENSTTNYKRLTYLLILLLRLVTIYQDLILRAYLVIGT